MKEICWFLIWDQSPILFNPLLALKVRKMKLGRAGYRGVKFERRNYSSYILYYFVKYIINFVILSNEFAQCDLCESNLKGFLLFPHTVFLNLWARLARHIENCY